MTIALLDYGAGNLTSVRKALEALGARVVTPEKPDVQGVDGVIVPGVGHFEATAALGPAWRAAILEFVEAGGALLGICLGMQWLYEGSTEAADVRGLGLLGGRCELLGSGDGDTADASGQGQRLKVPHVGWNELEIPAPSRLLEGIADRSFVYFTHSFAAPVTPETTAVTVHGRPFAAVVEHGRIAGVQFHPEKSGAVGLRILANFLTMATTHDSRQSIVDRR